MWSLSRLPLAEAERLIAAIKEKGARLSIPDVVDLSEVAADATGVTRIVIDAVQQMLLRIALQQAHDDYTSRRERQRQGIELGRENGKVPGPQGRRCHARSHHCPAERRRKHRRDGSARRL